jgi:N-hydroxyarylamine O-acetyltransferase
LSGNLEPHHFDLKAYLQRIGYSGPLEPSQPVLEALHLAHATHIPFENLGILLGRPISLDLDKVQAKLVTGRRGGYCFEQNLLFATVLTELGFSVKKLAARVRYRTQPVRHYAWTYRIMEEAGHWVLQSLHGDDWIDLYAFTLEEQLLADYQMANYYTSTHPDSRFVQTLTVQLSTPSSRKFLHNREFTEDFGTTVTHRMLADDDELLKLLADTFGLFFPAGTRFRYRETVS